MLRKRLLYNIVLFIFLFAACGSLQTEEEITDFYVSFLDSRREETIEYLEYCYDVTEDERQVAEESIGDILLDYEICEIKQINNSLFGITCLVKTAFIPDYYREIYNFVGIIDDRMYCFLNPYEVPDEISQNLNFEDYSYGENVMFGD